MLQHFNTNLPMRKRFRQGRRRAFHLYHACAKVPIRFGVADMKDVGGETRVLVLEEGELKRKTRTYFFFCWRRYACLCCHCHALCMEHHACGCAPQLAMAPATANAPRPAPLCMNNGGRALRVASNAYFVTCLQERILLRRLSETKMRHPSFAYGGSQ